MDRELPRSALSINNRNELRNVLHLHSLYKQNKVKDEGVSPHSLVSDPIELGQTDQGSSVCAHCRELEPGPGAALLWICLEVSIPSP